jgi:hypothetical protein
VAAIEDQEAHKRRRILQDALEMDKDADSDEDEDAGGANGDTKYVAGFSSPPTLCATSNVPALRRTAETPTGKARVAVMVTRTRTVMMTRTMTMRTRPQSCSENSRR